MKLFLLLGFSMISNFCFTQCDTISSLSPKDSAIINFITNLNTENYKGEKIGNVIKKDIIKEYCDRSYIQKIVGVLAGVNFSYKGFVSLRLYVSQKKCKKFIGKSDDWDFEKIKKCKVYKVEVLDYRVLK